MEEELIRSYYRRPLLGEQPKFVTTARILEHINAAIRSDGLRGYLLVACTPDEIGKLPGYSHLAF